MTFSKIAIVTAAAAMLAAPAFAETATIGTAPPATQATSGTPMKSSGTMMKSDTALKRSAPGVTDTETTATGGESGGIPERH